MQYVILVNVEDSPLVGDATSFIVDELAATALDFTLLVRPAVNVHVEPQGFGDGCDCEDYDEHSDDCAREYRPFDKVVPIGGFVHVDNGTEESVSFDVRAIVDASRQPPTDLEHPMVPGYGDELPDGDGGEAWEPEYTSPAFNGRRALSDDEMHDALADADREALRLMRGA